MKSLKEKVGLVVIIVIVISFLLFVVIATQFPGLLWGNASPKESGAKKTERKNNFSENERSGYVSDTTPAVTKNLPPALFSHNERITSLEKRIGDLQSIVEKQSLLLDAQKKFSEKFLQHIKETGVLDTTIEKRMSWIELELDIVNTKMLQFKNNIHLLTRQLRVGAQKGK